MKELLWNMIGFSSFNFMCYSIIPFFVQRSGATLLNISNVTTVIWSMLADILIFGKDFQLAYVIAFALEITGVVIFSAEKPINPESDSKEKDENEL
jgi:drug/metabolite transporter (DMT)-like permease